MAEKDLIIKEKIENSGLFEFSKLYSFAHTWWKNEGYGVVEDKYSEKISGTSRDLTIEWKITKDLSDYFKFEIKVKIEVTGMTEVEAEIDGEKRKMNKGKVSIEISSNLIKDRKNKWENSSFNKFLRDVYNKYVIKERVDSIEDKLKGDTKEFKEEVKKFLELTGKR